MTPSLCRTGRRAEVRAFPPKGPKELPKWVQARARRIGLRLEDRAARLIAQTAGDQERRPGQEYVDLWALANELDKLACFAGGEMVREADVQALTPVLRDQKGYFLCDALAEGRSAAAVKLLRELLAQDEPTQVILSTIAGRYRRLAIARELMDRGESSAAVGAATRTSGYALEKQMEQASRHNQERLRRLYRRVVEADLEAKLGERDEAVALELLVHDLASPAPEAE
ncbi:MAG: DNA polymerase III subunit delta [Chloroflexi bacterium]|nr:MAG: DNA polymerase III subunit delta [Chloroflexota bacterium]